jgi:hypothetical protein
MTVKTLNNVKQHERFVQAVHFILYIAVAVNALTLRSAIHPQSSFHAVDGTFYFNETYIST